jgi:hypothetical protein
MIVGRIEKKGHIQACTHAVCRDKAVSPALRLAAKKKGRARMALPWSFSLPASDLLNLRYF